MNFRRTVTIAVTLSFLALPSMAQVAPDEGQNAHHYQGGPKTETPHSKKHPKSTRTNPTQSTAGHHYQGGPKTVVPHHMGPKE
jgi:hypothetical protein